MSAEEDFIDYSDDELNNTTAPKKGAADADVPEAAADSSNNATAKNGSYVGIYSTTFRDFLLKPELIRATADCGFEHPSDVQQTCIPQALIGGDIICQAKSGSGKTAIFVLSTLQQIEPVDGECSVLVLCHTRELAFQIRNEYNRFSKYMPDVRTSVFYGGTKVTEDIATLRSPETHPHIVVGTPGRLNALVRDKHLRLGSVRMFVLDECDKMLEGVEMRRDVQDIFRATPRQKQVMMFSATLSQEILPICRKFLQNPTEHLVEDHVELALDGVRQFHIFLPEEKKIRKLVDILDQLDINQVMVFVKSRGRAEQLSKVLEKFNFPTCYIHGDMKQDERDAVYKKFKKGDTLRVCVATDIFGRGVDFERINLAINYDMPKEVATYQHRVGRAGRFGTNGAGISFLSTEEDKESFKAVEEYFKKTFPEYPEEGLKLKDGGNAQATEEVAAN
ncbi:Suppressor of the cold-sensitive snRNP bioproteinsis mutant brr1-1 [Sporothrix eucalyptigena]|uniref:RNA helicase n=1 Tax=Sporothrix eucalyptigena TaxID=1812306 RepID=A0ABP0C3M4_9PEZI